MWRKKVVEVVTKCFCIKEKVRHIYFRFRDSTVEVQSAQVPHMRALLTCCVWLIINKVEKLNKSSFLNTESLDEMFK